MDKLNTPLSDSFESESTISFISQLEGKKKPSTSPFDMLREASKVSAELLLESMPNIISLYFLGSYSSVAVQSSYGLVLVWTICFGYALYEGLSAGLESLLSTLKKEVSIVIYQRALVLCALLILPIFMFLYLSKVFVFPMLLDEDSNEIAGKMVLYCIISIFFNSTFLLSRSLMNSRHSFNNQLISTVVASLFHIVVCYLLFAVCGFTVYGAIIAKILTDIFNINFFMWLTQLKEELKPEHFQTMKLTQILELARTIMPRGIVMTLEILAYEVFTFQTVSLANEQISSHIIATNMHNIGYFIFTGISVVTYLKVGKYIVNYRRRCVEYIKNGALILLVVLLVFLLGMIYAPWRQTFTSEASVTDCLTGLTPLIVMFTSLDCLQVFLSSISRAVGKHKEAFQHFVISYFLIGEPFCFLLKWLYPENGLKNIWISMVLSVLLYNIWQGRTLWNVDLEVAAKII